MDIDESVLREGSPQKPTPRKDGDAAMCGGTGGGVINIIDGEIRQREAVLARMKTVAELEQTVIKYMRLVGMQEGTDFVDHAMEGTEPWEFTREEIATLERLSREG